MVILAEDIQEHFWSHLFFHLVTLSIEILRFLIVRIVGEVGTGYLVHKIVYLQ